MDRLAPLRNSPGKIGKAEVLGAPELMQILEPLLSSPQRAEYLERPEIPDLGKQPLEAPGP